MQRYLLYLFTLGGMLVLLVTGLLLSRPIGAQSVPAAREVAPQGVPALSPTPPASTPPPACGLGWRIVPSPNPGSNNVLSGVAALSANDIWAVGQTNGGALTEHWDGSSWSVVPSPGGPLNGVAAISANDVWAVGQTGTSTLIEHWNGSTWSIVPSPTISGSLHGVSAVAANDIWAVGQISGAALTEHWDGSSWTQVPCPSYALYGVAAIAANDVWAVGAYLGAPIMIIEHWDGSSWTQFSLAQNGIFRSVVAAASNDVWAVGCRSGNCTSGSTATFHWDGTGWSSVPNSNVSGALYGVTARAANEAWAVGGTTSGATLTMHCDLSSCSSVPSPSVGTSVLNGVAAVAANNIWAVGSSNGGASTLILHYSDPCAGSVTPTSTPTRTPTPSATPPPATATPTCVAVGTPGPWTSRANYPWYFSDVAVASDGSNIYGFAGFASGSRWGQAYRYNYVSNSWTAIANLPFVTMACAAEYGQNGKFYVIGGGGGNGANLVYDIATNSWSYAAAPPTSVIWSAHAYWNGKVYLIGGGSNPPSSGVYAYDITSNTWSTLAPLPQAEFGMAAGVINGKIYVANGQTGSGPTNNLYIYDIATDSWSQGASSPLASELPASTVIGGKLYLIGGDPTGGFWGYSSNTYLYDPVSDSWSQGPSLNVARDRANAATINTPGGQTALVVDGWGAAGNYLNSVEASTLPNVSCATPSATPTGTPTRPSTATPTAPPTHTPGGPSPTASPTATVCARTFIDVGPSNPFYTYIRCLACRGILSGYSTSPPCAVAPCFLPGANVTRGQTAKIVANAADFQDAIPSTWQTFGDVPYGSPFWVYVERAALHGVISGYSASPPCPPGQTPCFLPFNNVTRGQMAKIDAQAANYTDPIPSTQQTFQDVPNSNPFWVYIERAVLHGVISGYSTSPPCVSGGAPCYLWANAVTRGQTAKIVATTFYPNCQTPR